MTLEVRSEKIVRDCEFFRQGSLMLFENKESELQRGIKQEPSDSENGIGRGNEMKPLMSLPRTKPARVVGVKEEGIVVEEAVWSSIELILAVKKGYYVL